RGRGAAQRLGERLMGFAEAVEDALQAGAVAAQVLPEVAVGMEDAAGLEVRELHRLGGRARLEPQHRPVVTPELRLAGEDLPLAVQVEIDRFAEGVVRAAGHELCSPPWRGPARR